MQFEFDWDSSLLQEPVNYDKHYNDYDEYDAEFLLEDKIEKPMVEINKIYLNVPFEEKDTAKHRGAQWDSEIKKWYYTDRNYSYLFKRWIIEPAKTYDELSDEQQKFIDTALSNKNILVDACIGSGKTTAIQCLCNMMPDKQILYLTYNKLLKADARNKIILPNVTVTNYHGFAFMELKKVNIYAGPQDSIQKFLDVKPIIPKYNCLIIDEYQDIEEEFADLLFYIKSFNPTMQIIMVGDMEQKIYDKTRLHVPDFVPLFMKNYEILQFTKCFRLNKQLAADLGEIWGKHIEGVNSNCQVMYMNFYDIADFLSRQDCKDILCLGSQYGGANKLLNYLESNYNNKFNKNTVYATIGEVEKDSITPDSNAAIFTTYDSSKGMERKICVVCDFTEQYWYKRTTQHMTSYEILRNVFLVAASRGKDKIIFMKPTRKEEPLNKKVLAQSTFYRLDTNKPFRAFDMFAYKRIEDLVDCKQQLTIKQLQPANDIIQIKSHDGYIDLSPAIGIYQQAAYFKNYDIDAIIAKDNELNSYKIYNYLNKELQEKILLMTAAQTHQDRYRNQVKTPFINDEQFNQIKDRLNTEFTSDEEVEKEYSLQFRGYNDNTWRINCRIDVIKNNIPYELKFVNELGIEAYLQAGVYAAILDKPCILWNVKNNEKLEITVQNKQIFMDKVVSAISKGVVKKFKPVN